MGLGFFEEEEINCLLLGVDFSLLDLELFEGEGQLLGELGREVGLFEELRLEGIELRGRLKK